MKLVINQAFDNMGLTTSQQMGWILDGYMRNTPEGRDFVRLAQEKGVAEAVRKRDQPFGDYSCAPKANKPYSIP
jgi:enoyl-CoA hydratase